LIATSRQLRISANVTAHFGASWPRRRGLESDPFRQRDRPFRWTWPPCWRRCCAVV